MTNSSERGEIEEAVILSALRRKMLRGLRLMRDHWALFLAVSSGTGFLLSIAMHFWVFRQWGHQFLQIATPTDVLMSGLGILIELAPFALFGLVFFLLIILSGWSVNHVVSVGFARLAGKVRPVPSNWVTKFFKSVLVLSAWYLLLRVLVHLGLFRWALDVMEVGFFFGIGAVSSAIAIVALAENWGPIRNSMAAPFGFIAIASLGFWLALAIADYSDDGFYRNLPPISVRGSDFCSPNRLMWVGDETIAVRCLENRNDITVRRRIHMLHKQGSLVFETGPDLDRVFAIPGPDEPPS